MTGRAYRAALPDCLNIPPRARSMYAMNALREVALPVADGHHSYLQWLAGPEL